MERFTAQASVNIAQLAATAQVSREAATSAPSSRSAACAAQPSGQGPSNPARAAAPLPPRQGPSLTDTPAQSASCLGRRGRGGEQPAAVFTPRDIAHTAWAFSELMF
mmetsp:Transcript_142596/g.455789  ORF Transcript_142596/g.455789 Transcript_142596/m.455789 type:complete len:107 (-) Transcript_142596:559-879(-)